jgi:DNA-binding transcriptional LysR family regulator
MENFRLTVFRAVSAQMSFRKASEALHLSQPAVSQHVHALEEELGVRLFDRTGPWVSPTPAGKLLLKYAERSARILSEAKAALGRLDEAVIGELRLGASSTVAQYILPRILGDFLKNNPKVTLSVVSGNTEQIVSLLLKGSIAIGMIEGPPMTRAVHTEKFFEDRLVLIVPRSHEWNGVADVSVESIVEMPLLLREQGSGSRRVVEEALKEAGASPRRLNVVMELDSTEAIISGVEAGLGLGFVSEWAARKALRLRSVSRVRVDGLDILRNLNLVRRSGPAVDGAAGAFWRFALAQASEHP